MIVFDLRCGGGHVFEAWFASSAAYDEQFARRQLRCPVCDDAAVEKAIMAPAVAAKGNRQPAAMPAAVKATMAAIAAAQAKALARSRWVGTDFAATARAMHAGEREHATIHGQATIADARDLFDEGVPVMPLLVPVVPPDAIN